MSHLVFIGILLLLFSLFGIRNAKSTPRLSIHKFGVLHEVCVPEKRNESSMTAFFVKSPRGKSQIENQSDPTQELKTFVQKESLGTGASPSKNERNAMETLGYV